MDLSIRKLTKAFNRRVVFSDLTFSVPSGSRLAITGPNGSGKSTLLKILSGASVPTYGSVLYTLNNKVITTDQIFRYVHFVAPYNTVIEELTLQEIFHMHQRLGLLKSFRSFRQWLDYLSYSFRPDDQIKTFSSGMKQRLKLGLVLGDARPLIFLDEPGSNLDAQGKSWLSQKLGDIPVTHTVIVATNDPEEASLCSVNFSLNAEED